MLDWQKCVAETVQRFGGFVAKYMGDGAFSEGRSSPLSRRKSSSTSDIRRPMSMMPRVQYALLRQPPHRLKKPPLSAAK